MDESTRLVSVHEHVMQSNDSLYKEWVSIGFWIQVEGDQQKRQWWRVVIHSWDIYHKDMDSWNVVMLPCKHPTSSTSDPAYRTSNKLKVLLTTGHSIEEWAQYALTSEVEYQHAKEEGIN